jgi:hypothetical protein
MALWFYVWYKLVRYKSSMAGGVEIP